MKNIGTLIFLGILFFSCKAKKTIDSQSGNDSISVQNLPKDANKPIPTSIEFYQNVLPQTKFEQIKISSKMNVETPNNYLPTLDATIYIEKDNKIWMNITAFLFSVARGIATEEGIKAVIKTDKTYIDSDFEYLNNLLNTNFINYRSLEKLLMGRTFIRINSTDYLLNKNAQGYKMISLVNQKIESEGKIREYKIEMNYASNYDLQSIFLKDVNSEDELQVSYSNWENFKDFRMPKNVKIIIKGTKSSQILFENTKFDDSKMSTPFSIPGNYTKIEMK